MSVGGWAASHNPATFRDPNEFIPERWIDDAYASDSKIAMQPFSLGPGVVSARQDAPSSTDEDLT